MSKDGLEGYRALVENLDTLCGRIHGLFSGDITCREGCSGCCRHISVFPVEAAALREALGRVPRDLGERIRDRAGSAGPEDPCPLLEDGLCLLYQSRPVICRTQGLPLLIPGSEKKVDFCPLNFKGVGSFPGEAVIDLEKLNSVLSAVNDRFLSGGRAAPRPGRVTIAQSLLKEEED